MRERDGGQDRRFLQRRLGRRPLAPEREETVVNVKVLVDEAFVSQLSHHRRDHVHLSVNQNELVDFRFDLRTHCQSRVGVLEMAYDGLVRPKFASHSQHHVAYGLFRDFNKQTELKKYPCTISLSADGRNDTKHGLQFHDGFGNVIQRGFVTILFFFLFLNKILRGMMGCDVITTQHSRNESDISKLMTSSSNGIKSM